MRQQPPSLIEAWDHSPQAWGLQGGEAVAWHLAEEIPALLLFNSERFGVMMITPADFADFALGFALNEGIIGTAAEVDDIRIEPAGEGVMINIKVHPEAARRAATRRRMVAGQSSCGLCGTQTLELALPIVQRVQSPEIHDSAMLYALESLPLSQEMNRLNHSTHSAALCGPDGSVLLIREDIGRHNALDKLCGGMARAGRTGRDGFLLLSSRFSIELALKAAAMGIGWVLTVSAPSALALRIAGRAGMTVASQAGKEAVILFRPDIMDAERKPESLED